MFSTGLKQWFLECKVSPSLIHELDWWDEITFQPSEINSTTYSNKHDKLGSIRISCVPAQHNSARTGWDKCMTLWAGFVVEQFACKPSEAPSRTTVYFAG
jgi:N-acyl-phosphatidylethanolamine-hydrolysing phospholipase D